MHRLHLICSSISSISSSERTFGRNDGDVFSRDFLIAVRRMVRLFVCLDIFSCMRFTKVMWNIFCIFTSHCKSSKKNKNNFILHFFSLLDVTQTHLAITQHNRTEQRAKARGGQKRSNLISSLLLTLNSLQAVIYAKFNWLGVFPHLYNHFRCCFFSYSTFSSYDYDICVLIYVIFA